MVLADGCFDPLHYGHILYLSEASAFGLVTVRVAPDSDIVAKGRKPFQTREERVRTLAALRMVEEVCEDDTLAGAIHRLKPVYLVKGPDWRGKLPESVLYACEEEGTEVHYTAVQDRTSTERLRA